jgi:hypothetical protein
MEKERVLRDTVSIDALEKLFEDDFRASQILNLTLERIANAIDDTSAAFSNWRASLAAYHPIAISGVKWVWGYPPGTPQGRHNLAALVEGHFKQAEPHFGAARQNPVIGAVHVKVWNVVPAFINYLNDSIPVGPVRRLIQEVKDAVRAFRGTPVEEEFRKTILYLYQHWTDRSGFGDSAPIDRRLKTDPSLLIPNHSKNPNPDGRPCIPSEYRNGAELVIYLAFTDMLEAYVNRVEAAKREQAGK